MIWLERPPWAKWIAVAVVSVVALWMEVKPQPYIDHPFATVDIAPGDQLGRHNTELRPVPEGLLELPEDGSHALVAIPMGTPVLAEHTGEQNMVLPPGWWIVSLDLPQGAAVGDRVRVVLLDDGDLIEGVVSSNGVSDGFTVSSGGVAVAPGDASRVAAAAGNGRVSVLLSTG